MEPKRWWLDETAHAGSEHLDPSYVTLYDAKAQFDPFEDLEKLRALGLGRDSVVIDIGSGTGTFAVAASDYAKRVIAVDVSPAMTRALRSRIEEDRLPNIDVVEAGFLSYRHDGPPAHFVFSRNALHQLPDFWKVLSLTRIHQLLVPGGVLRLRDIVYDLEPTQVEEAIDRWVDGGADDPTAGYTGAELAEHVRTEHSTFSWLFEPMLDITGFEILDRHYRAGVYATYTCRSL